MKKLFLIFCLLIFCLSGQAQTFSGNIRFVGFYGADSLYTGTVEFNDQTNRFLGTGIQVNDLIIDGAFREFTVDSILSPGPYFLTLRLKSIGHNNTPFGRGHISRPLDFGLIPISAADKDGLTPEQESFIHQENINAINQKFNTVDDSLYSIKFTEESITVNALINEDMHDAWQQTDGGRNANTVIWDDYETENVAAKGFIFSGLDIPAGVTITSAVFSQYDYDGGFVDVSLFIEDTASPKNFEEIDFDITDRSVYADSVIWNIDAFDTGAYQDSPDFSNILQNLVNEGAVDEISVILKHYSGFYIGYNFSDGVNLPRLTITYTTVVSRLDNPKLDQVPNEMTGSETVTLCSSGCDYSTLADAISYGETIKPKTFETLTIEVQSGYTFTSGVVLKNGFDYSHVIIEGSDGSFDANFSEDDFIKFNNSRGLRIENLRLTNISAGSKICFNLENFSSLTLSDVDIYDFSTIVEAKASQVTIKQNTDLSATNEIFNLTDGSSLSTNSNVYLNGTGDQITLVSSFCQSTGIIEFYGSSGRKIDATGGSVLLCLGANGSSGGSSDINISGGSIVNVGSSDLSSLDDFNKLTESGILISSSQPTSPGPPEIFNIISAPTSIGFQLWTGFDGGIIQVDMSAVADSTTVNFSNGNGFVQGVYYDFYFINGPNNFTIDFGTDFQTLAGGAYPNVVYSEAGRLQCYYDGANLKCEE